MVKIEILVDDIFAFNNVAEEISSLLKQGDKIILQGNLGSGKTQFVKACLKKLNYNELVSSPTFTIVHFYNTDFGIVIHTDLYRLKSVNEFFSLGLEEFSSEAIMFIEWGDRFIEYFNNNLTISFDFINENPDYRKITLYSTNIEWIDRLKYLKLFHIGNN